MDNSEMEQQSPEKLSTEIVELTLAMSEDTNIEEGSESHIKGWDKIDELKKQLAEMVPEDQVADLIKQTEERIKKESDWPEAQAA